MAACEPLSCGFIGKIKETNEYAGSVILKVLSLTRNEKSAKYGAVLSDGEVSIPASLASQLSALAENGTLHKGCIVKIDNYTANNVPERGFVLMVPNLEVLEASSGTEDVMLQADGVVSITPQTPTGKRAMIKEEHPSPSPSQGPSAKLMKTPTGSVIPSHLTHPSPPSQLTVSKRTKGFHKISQLNPYDEDWHLKAKLLRKGQLRSITSKGVPCSIFTVELVDTEGGQAQGTFWRAQADNWFSTLEEGKVYVFEKFQVRVANKLYSTVKGDYEIHFTDKTEVTEAADQGVAEIMTVAVSVTPITQLPRYIGRKTPVDVLGVVVAVGSLGTVKRKSDNSDLSKKDVTLVDTSGKTVVLTLWGSSAISQAAEEATEGSLLQCTACRVTDYNGCSVSSLQRSEVTLDPVSKAAQEMQEWWQSKGKGESHTPVGAELAGARPSGGATPGGAAARNQLSCLSEVTEQSVPDPSAKPVYHNVLSTVAMISTDQSLYYLANPETQKKVVEQDGRFYSESDKQYCDKAEYRYLMTLRVKDATGEALLNLFNEQGQALLGMTADELVAMRQEDEAKFTKLCKDLKFTEWAVTTSTKSREYNGENRMRHTVQTIRPVDFVADGRRLLEAINRYN